MNVVISNYTLDVRNKIVAIELHRSAGTEYIPSPNQYWENDYKNEEFSEKENLEEEDSSSSLITIITNEARRETERAVEDEKIRERAKYLEAKYGTIKGYSGKFSEPTVKKGQATQIYEKLFANEIRMEAKKKTEDEKRNEYVKYLEAKYNAVDGSSEYR